MKQIALRYQSGESARSIADDLGTTYHVIQRRLQGQGVSLRGPGPGVSGGRKISELRSAKIDEQRLRELHSRGLSVREIWAELGGRVSEEAIRRRMKKLDLPRLAAKARPEKNHFWTGGLSVDEEGYILQKSPGHPHATAAGYVRQHRLVMERVLGRHLLPSEVVDHRNGDPSDNRPENLTLYSSNGEHLRATRTGKPKISRQEREKKTEEAVLRARRRVAAILAGSETDAGQ